MYKFFFKRLIDLILSLCAIIVLSPILIILTIIGALAMKGNPFFLQKRPGYKENIFKLIKFRTMSNAKDREGNLLPNEVRLNRYGRILRSTSIDELPELFNILKGDMSIVGPRPLLPEYLPFYTDEEHHRHDVRPGLTGLAQVNGRNAIGSWEERFNYDLQYVEKCSLYLDIGIILQTVIKVVKKSDILIGSSAVVGRLDEVRKRYD
jgi:lipopolysaccharide/colanic/teichoic acid biosynthesis glycosyltransferase